MAIYVKKIVVSYTQFGNEWWSKGPSYGVEQPAVGAVDGVASYPSYGAMERDHSDPRGRQFVEKLDDRWIADDVMDLRHYVFIGRDEFIRLRDERRARP